MKKCAFEFYNAEDMGLFDMLGHIPLLKEDITVADIRHNTEFKTYMVQEPDVGHMFLHEAAIIEFKGALYASWYQCEVKELQGPTPICGRRSFDGGKSWTDIVAYEADGQLYIIYTVNMNDDWVTRGAMLSVLPIDSL